MFNSDNVLVPEVVGAGFDPFRARVAMGGFLAGYSGKTFEAYALDLRQWSQWCLDHDLDLFEVRRAHIELFADVGQIGDEVFITGSDLSARDDTGVWSTLDGTNWTRLELPDLPDFTRLSQVEVSESALVTAGDQSSTGIIASRPRR